MKTRCLIVLSLLALSGCQWRRVKPTGYETVGADLRNTELARKHNAKAVRLIKEERFDKAEKELKAALEADTFFGPAHNNLGNVYYRQKKYYLAAWEFQYAVKLMPNRPQPRNNLGLVFEAVGKLDDAAKWYEEALQLEPDSVEVIGNLARAYVRKNRKDARTRKLLEDLVLKDHRPEWVAWARQRLMSMPKPEPAGTEPADE